MSSPKRYSIDPQDQALRHRLRNWAANQPLPRNGRERLLRSALLASRPAEEPVFHYFVLHPAVRINWTATYLAGDRLLNLRLVS